ncbi:MAG TPA: helix-hairpin-helix domain-containing protein [Thermoplasmata archaeon]|nr:helix-hairpin-helix domain-containing protein [Thermoplasmata archaeon]
MRANAEVAERLREIADLLDLQGEKFKPEAYRRAARSIEATPEDLADLAKRGTLGSIPGVGEAIEEKTREFLKEGKIPYLERLRLEVPPGLVEIMRLPGLGPKTARRFHLELGIEGPAELSAAIEGGRLNGVKGFGPTKIAQIREALAAAGPPAARMPLAAADAVARALVAALTKAAPIDRIEIAGSLRRRRETIGDLDILTTSDRPEEVLSAFGALPDVQKVVLRGTTKETVRLASGTQVDLRVVAPEEFGAALQYFTGSKDHNVHLRTLARDKGLKVNEYGVYRGEERIASRTEEEVYAALGFRWMPPEIREDHGEIDAALAGTLPRLIALGDLKGNLHVHTPLDPSAEELRKILDEGRALGFDYLGLVVPDAEPAAEVVRAREGAQGTPKKLHVLLGVERESGRPAPLPRGIDYWIATPAATASPAGRERGGPKGAPPPALLAHGLPGGPEKTVSGPPVDINPESPESGIDSARLRSLAESGVPLHLSAGVAPGTPRERMDLAVGFARRGWATPATIANTRGWPWGPPSKSRP